VAPLTNLLRQQGDFVMDCGEIVAVHSAAGGVTEVTSQLCGCIKATSIAADFCSDSSGRF
jgi:hypothetical protein